MIRNHDEIDRQTRGCDAVGQLSEHLVDMPDCLASFWSFRSIFMSCMVCIRKIQSDEMRSLLRWKLKPPDDLVHAHLIGKLVVIGEVVAGTFSLYLCFRARPEEAGRSPSLFFR